MDEKDRGEVDNLLRLIDLESESMLAAMGTGDYATVQKGLNETLEYSKRLEKLVGKSLVAHLKACPYCGGPFAL